jgi:hypothetical protein
MSAMLGFAMLMCNVFASLFLALVAQGRLDALIARRMFTIINLLAALLVSFDTQYAEIAKFLLSIIGPSVVGAALSLLASFLPLEGELRKRNE